MVLNLKKIYENVLIISELEEENNYMLGFINYEGSFENFLKIYSFKVDDPKVLTIYNDDWIPYERTTYNEFHYLPLNLLNEGTKESIEDWYKEKLKEKIQMDKDDRLINIAHTEIEIIQLQKKLERLKEEDYEGR